MPSDKIFFDSIKQDRGWYFVEYKPPHPTNRFAMLSIVVPEPTTTPAVAAAMERELTLWLQRYPVPLMVFAFDAEGGLYRLEGTRPSDHLMGYLDGTTGKPCMFWQPLSDKEIPGEVPSLESLLRIYTDVPYKTSAQLQHEAEVHARQIRIGRWIVLAWVAVVPAVWIILQLLGPVWLGILASGYGLWQALVKALKLLGKWKVSPRELKAREEERRMRHHHYHCERNPEGFLRLKIENFEHEERERIQNEAKALKAASEQ
jgi:hypothetical protein